MISNENNTSLEIKRRILIANRCFYGLKKQMKSKMLTLQTKLRIYKTLIRPVLTYASESWIMNKQDRERLGVFERKILRAIYGPVRMNDDWRIRYNSELYDMYKELDIIGFIKIGRLQWAGHVMRMDESRPARRVLLSDPGGNRVRGRPKSRWEDNVELDAGTCGIRNWKARARNRQEWNSLLKKTRTLKGLLSQ